jgi:hypothetical protein
MILKERDPREHLDNDIFSLAGADAENQMAFYLRRAFAGDKNVVVFNDLRFKDETGDAAQIDHLVMHRHGYVIIESKSVTSCVKINKHGEWTRFWNGVEQGMSSPIQQAKRQIVFLQRALHANSEILLGKALGIIQGRFKNCPFETIVAISDKGTIEREEEVPEVVKADQVPDRIHEIVARHKKAASLLSLSVFNLKSNDGIYDFKDDEMFRMAKFLTDHHFSLKEEKGQHKGAAMAGNISRPASPPVVPPPSPPVQAARPAPPPPPAVPQTASDLGVCDKCGAQCDIQWGRFSYYWKCPSCDANMAIKEYCPICKVKMKLRKDKARYFILCEPCKTEKLYCEFE